MEQRTRRTVKACVICHKKKVRCDIDEVEGNDCSNCIRDNYECVPRERKRKRYTISTSPPPTRTTRARQAAAESEESDRPSFHEGLSVIPNVALGADGISSHLREDRGHLNRASTATTRDDIRQESYTTPNTTLSAGNIDPSLASNGATGTPTNVSYLGRLEYLRNDVPVNDEAGIPGRTAPPLSDTDLEILRIQKVSELPPRSIRESLLDAFWTRCFPWSPVVERKWVENRPPEQISPLLLNAMLLAGSRVSALPTGYSPEMFYKKARMLFWMGAEEDPIITIAASCLLHWWNPEGPECVSLDTSEFWLRVAVGLAYQVGLHKEPSRKPNAGLRRRIWWSLVVRDCLINAGHGRPRAVDLRLMDVALPSIHDFEGAAAPANLFAAYVGISSILGDLTQSFLRKSGFQEQKASLENRLYRWIKTLPESLDLCRSENCRLLKPYNFESRQLHVQYFTVLIIINRSLEPPSTASLLAASFVAGIFEDFLARDELRYLGPIFTFYLLAAGMAQLSCYRYSGLWDFAVKDLHVIFSALDELSKRWPSAVGSLKHLTDVRHKIMQRPRLAPFPENNLTPEKLQFFEGFSPEICRIWQPIEESACNQTIPNRELETAGILQGLRTPAMQFSGLDGVVRPEGVANGHAHGQGHVNESFETAFMHAEDLFPQYEGIGNWLLIDWDQGLG
ncbi:hypothetical protein K432DRAFT_421829 [Lepidopterella palustris CBS 459.81]|uniref:Zn(2)-C6 fungal-type domain-containing protein n=1 Tax=Lepidopterella palustris CBS 459.81 TaxID=1314670 RepID=A0A8E2EK84_9PEZI|nr:hypothetical protein K432DRAFT_421829 [Lepidopterella palustris CBS 459.81]